MHDFRVIGKNETDHYNIREQDKPYIKRILGVYMYDNNRHIHVCSLTPSVELRHLYNTVELNDMEISDEKRDDLLSEYEHQDSEEFVYLDVYVLESHRSRNADLHCIYGEHNNVPAIADFDTEEEWYQALEESVHEYLRCNHKV